MTLEETQKALPEFADRLRFLLSERVYHQVTAADGELCQLIRRDILPALQTLPKACSTMRGEVDDCVDYLTALANRIEPAEPDSVSEADLLEELPAFEGIALLISKAVRQREIARLPRKDNVERDRRIHDAASGGTRQNVIALDEKVSESIVSRVLSKPRP